MLVGFFVTGCDVPGSLKRHGCKPGDSLGTCGILFRKFGQLHTQFERAQREGLASSSGGDDARGKAFNGVDGQKTYLGERSRTSLRLGRETTSGSDHDERFVCPAHHTFRR